MLNLIDFYKEVRHFTPHNMSNLYKLGIDIGSTTVKVALMNDNDDIIFPIMRDIMPIFRIL